MSPSEAAARMVVRKWNETCIYMTPTDANLLTDLIDAALRTQLDTSMRVQEQLAANVNAGLLEIRALKEHRAQCERALPSTFFGDRPLEERTTRLASSWAKAVQVTYELEQQLAAVTGERGKLDNLTTMQDGGIRALHEQLAEQHTQWTKTNAQYESAAKAVTRLTGELAEAQGTVGRLIEERDFARQRVYELDARPVNHERAP